MEESELETEIATAAQEPASAASDGQSATNRPIDDLIKADQYLTRKRVARCRGFFGQIAIAKIVPPGAVEAHGSSCRGDEMPSC